MVDFGKYCCDREKNNSFPTIGDIYTTGSVAIIFFWTSKKSCSIQMVVIVIL